ncbi:MAG: hypothetical protein IK099_03310 [Clostridia bacterium]|nr:hypothetical protein [Clostridia bacterium]
MKKFLLICLALCLLVPSVFAEEEASFLSLTKLDETQDLLDSGVTIEKVYYTDGYGFSTSEFTTTDPEEIAALWTALTMMELGEPSYTFITDWYPQIVFYLSDGTHRNVCFDAHWLEISGMENYCVLNDEPFWTLTACLVRKYMGE